MESALDRPWKNAPPFPPYSGTQLRFPGSPANNTGVSSVGNSYSSTRVSSSVVLARISLPWDTGLKSKSDQYL